MQTTSHDSTNCAAVATGCGHIMQLGTFQQEKHGIGASTGGRGHGVPLKTITVRHMTQTGGTRDNSSAQAL